MTDQFAIQAEGLTKHYLPPSKWLRPFMRSAAKAEVHALRDVSLEVDRGEFEELLWPALAARVPAFDTLRGRNAAIRMLDLRRRVCGGHALFGEDAEAVGKARA